MKLEREKKISDSKAIRIFKLEGSSVLTFYKIQWVGRDLPEWILTEDEMTALISLLYGWVEED